MKKIITLFLTVSLTACGMDKAGKIYWEGEKISLVGLAEAVRYAPNSTFAQCTVAVQYDEKRGSFSNNENLSSLNEKNFQVLWEGSYSYMPEWCWKNTRMMGVIILGIVDAEKKYNFTPLSKTSQGSEERLICRK